MNNEVKPDELVALVNYQNGAVVSKTIIEKETGTVTLFAFAMGVTYCPRKAQKARKNISCKLVAYGVIPGSHSCPTTSWTRSHCYTDVGRNKPARR